MTKKPNPKNSPTRPSVKPGIAPPIVPEPNRTKFWSQVGVFLLGVLSGVITTGVIEATNLFKPDIAFVEAAPRVKMSVSFENGVETATFEVRVRAKNHRLAPGHVSEVKIVPADGRYVPEVQVIALDRSDIGGFEERELFVRYFIRHPIDKAGTPGHASMEFFDQNGRVIGSILLGMNSDPNEKL